MATDYDKARQELDAILAGLMTDKKMQSSDKRLLASNNRSEEWHKKTAERNRKNATNDEINKKIGNAHRGKKINKESIEKRVKTWKENGNQAWNKEKTLSQSHKDNLSKALKGKKVKEETKIKLQTSSALCKPFVTPVGVFWTKTKAAEYYLQNKLTGNTTKGSTNVWLSRQIKAYPDQYYYITKEEYTLLTGHDPLDE